MLTLWVAQVTVSASGPWGIPCWAYHVNYTTLARGSREDNVLTACSPSVIPVCIYRVVSVCCMNRMHFRLPVVF